MRPFVERRLWTSMPQEPRTIIINVKTSNDGDGLFIEVFDDEEICPELYEALEAEAKEFGDMIDRLLQLNN